MELDTEFTTIAVELKQYSDSPPDVDSVARVSFYSASKQLGGSTQYKFFPAARCKDIYAAEISAGNDFYTEEFGDGNWICPDVRQITIQNNPFIFDSGSNFNMVVNDCLVATE